MDVYGVDVDFLGNVVVVGSFLGTADFGGGNLSSVGSNDWFVAKYNPFGVHVWSQRFGESGSDVCRGVAIDVNGALLLTGTGVGALNFGGGALVPIGSTDVFVVKLNSTGTHEWSKVVGGSGNETATSCATDGSNLYITGSFFVAANFGGSNLVSAGSSDIFVAKFNSVGTHQWSAGYGSTSADAGEEVIVEAFSNPVVAGVFGTSVNFGGSTLTSAGLADIFLVKFNSTGVHQWSKSFGSIGPETSPCLAREGTNVYLAGGFFNTVNFGGSNLVSAGSNDMFVAKFNSAGTHQWSMRFGTSLSETVNDISADALGVALVSFYASPIDFGGGPVPIVGPGTNDMIIAKFSTGGSFLWSDGYGGPGSVDSGKAVATDVNGNVVVGSTFYQTANFGGDYFFASAVNVCLAKYGVFFAEPAIASITDVGNDQGRTVKIDFSSSGNDNPLVQYPTTVYEAYRRNDAAPVTAVQSGSPASRQQLLDAGWTFAGSTPAHAQSFYSIDAPTIGDSTVANGQYYSVFFIRAASASPSHFADSMPDSGYSLDNLAPGVPLNFVYESGNLEWDESSDEDFDFFTVYGSNADDFGSATLVNYTTSPALDVSASPYAFYWVTATDFAGNEGKPARVNTLSGAGGTPKSYVLSVSNYPNPFNPRTTVSYTLPARGRVTVAVFDARGSHVATLFDGDRPAGAYTLEWNPGATVSSGIYFARIDHNDATRSKKMVLLK